MVSVARNGQAIDDIVLNEELTVRVGRRDVLNEGEPGSAALTLWLSEWLGVAHGDRITITDRDLVRFDGKVTDVPATWWEEDPDDPDRLILGMRIMCAGPLARWGRDRIGDEPWPSETVAQRAERISGLVGSPLVVQGGAELMVIGRDVDSRPAVQVLQDLAADAAGWLYDHAGQTYLQSLDARRHGDPQERWDDQTTTWDEWEGSWDEQTGSSPALPRTVHLPPDAVLWAPQWEQTSLIANAVTVTYGPPDPETGLQQTVAAEDPDSIDAHGRSQPRVTTRLLLAADAQLRAALTMERAAWPQWHLPAVQVAWELLDDETAAQLDDMLPGIRCQVTGMPLPGPSTAFDGCIEGWIDHWAWDDQAEAVLRTTTLHLSDVRWSFAVLTWDGFVPDELTWDDIDASWDQLITADDLQEEVI